MSPFQEKRFLPRRTATAAERERLTQAIRERLMREPDVLFAYLHGSFVTGDAFRDIDVGIYTAAPKGFSYESELSYELSRAHGHEIEVRAVNDAPVAFQMAVILEGTVGETALTAGLPENNGVRLSRIVQVDE
jgi:predicted nucleotidyltransferase